MSAAVAVILVLVALGVAFWAGLMLGIHGWR